MNCNKRKPFILFTVHDTKSKNHLQKFIVKIYLKPWNIILYCDYVFLNFFDLQFELFPTIFNLPFTIYAIAQKNVSEYLWNQMFPNVEETFSLYTQSEHIIQNIKFYDKLISQITNFSFCYYFHIIIYFFPSFIFIVFPLTIYISATHLVVDGWKMEYYEKTRGCHVLNK
jgi:hypothetical protein